MLVTSAFPAEVVPVLVVDQSLLPRVQLDRLEHGQGERVYEPPYDGAGGESSAVELPRLVGCRGRGPRPPPGQTHWPGSPPAGWWRPGSLSPLGEVLTDYHVTLLRPWTLWSLLGRSVLWEHQVTL